jgi:hypothetical protein
MALFEVTGGEARPIAAVAAGADLYEKEIESLLWSNLEALLGESLFPVARQPKLDLGGVPDIVALDESGRVVVVEVKRDVDRGQLAQCLEYAGWARTTNLDELASIYHGGVTKFFEDWQDFTQSSTPAVVNPAPRLVLVAGDLHGRTRSAVDFLVENGLPVQVVTVSVYEDDAARRYLDVRHDSTRTISRVPTSEAATSGKGLLYQQFWAAYLKRLRVEHPSWSGRKAALSQNWMNQPSPIKGTTIDASFASGGRLRHELYIDTLDGDQNIELLHRFEDQREALEAAYGRSLVYEELPGKRACRIADYKAGADVSDIDRYDEYVDWFFDAGARLRSALEAVDVGAAE